MADFVNTIVWTPRTRMKWSTSDNGVITALQQEQLGDDGWNITGLVCFMDLRTNQRTIFPCGERGCSDFADRVNVLVADHVNRHQENSDFCLTLWRGKELPEADYLLNKNFSSTRWGVGSDAVLCLALVKEIGACLKTEDSRRELSTFVVRWIRIVIESIGTDWEACWKSAEDTMCPLFGGHWKRK